MSSSVKGKLSAVWGLLLLLWCLISKRLSSTVLRARHCTKNFTACEKMNHAIPYLFREIKHVHKSFNKMQKMTASIRTEEGGYQGGEEGGVILPRKACRIISNRSTWRAGELYFHRG